MALSQLPLIIGDDPNDPPGARAITARITFTPTLEGTIIVMASVVENDTAKTVGRNAPGAFTNLEQAYIAGEKVLREMFFT